MYLSATWTEKVMIDDENDDGDLADHLQEVKKTPIVEDDGLCQGLNSITRRKTKSSSLIVKMTKPASIR